MRKVKYKERKDGKDKETTKNYDGVRSTMTELASATEQSRQNLTNKMSRGNFTEKDIFKIAEALGCTVNIEFTLPDGTTI